MSWQKEKKEHPWASTSIAKRIASDHKKSKPKRRDYESPAHERTEHHKALGPGNPPLFYVPQLLDKIDHQERLAQKIIKGKTK